MIDDSGFYEPPKRERSYESDGRRFSSIRWMPGMPRGKEYEGEPFQDDSRVLCTGYVEGIVRGNNIQSTPSNRYKKEQRVVDFELDLPGTAFDRKIVVPTPKSRRHEEKRVADIELDARTRMAQKDRDALV